MKQVVGKWDDNITKTMTVGQVSYPDYSLLNIIQQFELYSDMILVPLGIILNVWSFWTFYKMENLPISTRITSHVHCHSRYSYDNWAVFISGAIFYEHAHIIV